MRFGLLPLSPRGGKLPEEPRSRPEGCPFAGDDGVARGEAGHAGQVETQDVGADDIHVGVGAQGVFERRQEARNPFYRVVEITDTTTDPAVWGRNWPRQFESFMRTVDYERTRYGGYGDLPIVAESIVAPRTFSKSHSGITIARCPG